MMKNGYDQEYVVQLGMNLEGLTYFGLIVRRDSVNPIYGKPVSLPVLRDLRGEYLSKLDAAMHFLARYMQLPEGVNDPGIYAVLQEVRAYLFETEDIAVHVLPKRKSW